MESKKQQYILRFKALHRLKTGLELSDAEALVHFEKLIALIRAVYRPVPINTFENESNA